MNRYIPKIKIKDLFVDYKEFNNFLEIYKQMSDVDVEITELDYQIIVQLYGNFQTKYVERFQGQGDAVIAYINAFETYLRYKELYDKKTDDFLNYGNQNTSESFTGDYTLSDNEANNNFSNGKVVNTTQDLSQAFVRLAMNENPRFRLYREYAQAIVYPVQNDEPQLRNDERDW